MSRVTRPEPAPHLDPDRAEARSEAHATARLAATARSILACPAELDLLVDGVATVLEGQSDGVGGSVGGSGTGGIGGFGVRDGHGSPTLTCAVDSDLARAAAAGRSALLTLASGLGEPGCPERDDSLVLAGRLEVLGREEFECCAEPHTLVGVRLCFALLTRRGDAHEPAQQHRVPLEALRSPAHALNAGFLQRTTEHANAGHQDELRRAVALSAGVRMGDVVGVRLSGLSPRGVVVTWVDARGAHRTGVDFIRPARTPAELGDLLRRELHAGPC